MENRVQKSSFTPSLPYCPTHPVQAIAPSPYGPNLEHEFIPEGWCATYGPPSCVCCAPSETVILPAYKVHSLLPYSYAALAFPRPDQVHLTVGPIIGVVTPVSARIVVEVSQDYEVSVKAVGRVEISPSSKREEQSQAGTKAEHIATTSKCFIKGIPGALVLTGLIPSTRYTLFFNVPVPHLLCASFTTKSDPSTCRAASNLKVAIVGGHKGFSRTDEERHLKLLLQQQDEQKPARLLKKVVFFAKQS